MDKVALMPLSERAALFGETGAGMGLASTIAEKDFWVCWSLRRIFALPEEGGLRLIFKGGTSLSKAYGAIRRFSEDIDLSFDRAALGYTGERDPQQDGLKRKAREKLIDELVSDVKRHIAARFLPTLRTAMAEQLGEPAAGGWALTIDDEDPQTVNFRYPAALSAADYGKTAYVAPQVRLELGARGDPWPMETKRIHPYAFDQFPDWFKDPYCDVAVLSAQRTFWEKATLLHAEAHRALDKPLPDRLSRHYYDLVSLLNIEEGANAAKDFDLLDDVAKHKAVFFASGWANYGAARPGTLKLIPPDERLAALRADYAKMAPMMFDQQPPKLDDLLQRIRQLQEEINGAA
jgi:hypothetical protein